MAGILDQLLGGADPGAGGPPPPGGLDLPPSMPDPEAGLAAPMDEAEAPEGPGDEVGTLKEMLGLADAYLQLPTVTEQERAQMQSATSVIQKLLASNEKLGEQISGTAAGQRKVFGAGA